MRLFFLGVFCLSMSCLAQPDPKKIDRPKLVVGILVDQMRYDFLYRYYERYSDGGFKRLMNQGFNFKNAQYHYASTVTGPGHAHSFNGSVPSISGIVGNDWYDKKLKKLVYVTSDSTVNLVGDGTAAAGKMSPRNMKVTSICDQMRISNQFKSKTVGIALKDRGAILPAGPTGDAYWYDVATSNWITSSFYKPALPAWVKAFNDKKLPAQYIAKDWTTLYPITTYASSEADDQAYENPISGDKTAVFPHKILSSSLASSPYGNELTKEFGLQALESEGLGKDEFCDFLTLSFSSPDYAGHAFGPQSIELEDIYLRLDKNIEEILNTLDRKVGKDQYAVFLTADHGVAEIPGFLMKNKMPAGLMIGGENRKKAEAILTAKFGEANYILADHNYQMYLNLETLSAKKISVEDIKNELKQKLTLEEGVADVFNLTDPSTAGLPLLMQNKINGLFNPKRSGEILVLYEPAWLSGYVKGTSHGTMYSYDTHVPMLWYGRGIKKGSSTEPVYISDIAPTLAAYLSILEPNGNVGKPLNSFIAK